MDINALLQMLQGGGGQSLQGGSGGITAPVAPQMASPTLQMPQFSGAGGNSGVQQAAMAARQAMSQPQPQQQSPMSSMMGSSNPMMMAMLMQKMQGQNQQQPGQQKVVTPSMSVSPGSVDGQQLSTINIPAGTPSSTNANNTSQLGGIFSGLFGGGRSHQSQQSPDVLSQIIQAYGFLRNLGGAADNGSF